MKTKKSIQVRSLFGVVCVCLMLVGATLINNARADQFDARINVLQNRNAKNQAVSDQLASRASSYSDAINRLQKQIDSLQAAIADNQHKSDELQKQIVKAQADLAQQKKVLGENIKAMYLEGQTSTLEVLASSKDLSDFVDKQQARNAVSDKVKDTVNKIASLQQQLKSKQNRLKQMIADQKAQNSELASTQAQQSHMLAYTQSQKAAYDQKIKNNNTEIASLRAAQAAANRALGGAATAGDPGHGGYPAYLDNAIEDSLVDPWGMLNRECVSYTAWKVYQTFGHMPYWGGSGNANQWPADARAAGIATGSVPRVHSVAISMGGAYGHAMWVEGVSGNYIHVSQYNYDLAGHYSEMTINGAGLIYIYFN